MIQQIEETTKFLQSKVKIRPKYAIILGTGLGSLVKDIDIEETLPYDIIPNFPVSTVESHSGRLVFGKLSGKEVMVMQGRFHYYEGYNLQQITFPVRVMKLFGIEKLFISNAAGGLDPAHQVSDLMIISDHINLLPDNPLRGENLNQFGGRFPDMSDAYDETLIKQAQQITLKNDIKAHTGVYAAVPGPNLETKAEYRYLRIIGADAVGMSTVPENLVARHMGMPCFALSVITDICTPGNIKQVQIEDVLAAAAKAEPGMTTLFRELIASQP